MTKTIAQRSCFLLLFIFGLTVAAVAFYRVRAAALATDTAKTDGLSITIVSDAQAQALSAEAGQSGIVSF